MMRRNPSVKGAHNLRDLGGYPTKDGRETAWGRLFRSGTLAHLDEEGLRQLRALNIRTIVDFRSDHERRTDPSAPALENVDMWRHKDEVSVGDVSESAQQAARPSDRSEDFMARVYRQLPFRQATSFRALCNKIAASAEPVLFHCTLGKDRTGVAAAIVLDLVGVERKTVIEDYLLSNDFVDGALNVFRRDKTLASLADAGEDVWAPIATARQTYLEGAFDEIEARHGGIEGYAREALGLEASTINAMRNNLLG